MNIRLLTLGVLAMSMHAVPAAPHVLDGPWGGDRLNPLIDGGEGRLEMDCASGTLAGPLHLNASGSFTANGSFEEHRPGPQAADAAASGLPTRYSAQVKQDVMTLSILPRGAKAPQVFTLKRGVRVKLVRCL